MTARECPAPAPASPSRAPPAPPLALSAHVVLVARHPAPAPASAAPVLRQPPALRRGHGAGRERWRAHRVRCTRALPRRGAVPRPQRVPAGAAVAGALDAVLGAPAAALLALAACGHGGGDARTARARTLRAARALLPARLLERTCAAPLSPLASALSALSALAPVLRLSPRRPDTATGALRLLNYNVGVTLTTLPIFELLYSVKGELSYKYRGTLLPPASRRADGIIILVINYQITAYYHFKYSLYMECIVSNCNIIDFL